MSAVKKVHAKVQKILTQNLGSAEIDEAGHFIVRHNSAITFVEVGEGFGDDGVVIAINCPLLTDVKLTNELFRHVATEGQQFKIGGLIVQPDDKGKTGWVLYCYSIIADDLDESELMQAVLGVSYIGDDIGADLQKQFGGKLFGDDESE
jgi:hypothetical protein